MRADGHWKSGGGWRPDNPPSGTRPLRQLPSLFCWQGGSGAERNCRKIFEGWLGEEETLEQVAAGIPQRGEFRLSLDALGNDRDIEGARHHHDARDAGL